MVHTKVSGLSRSLLAKIQGSTKTASIAKGIALSSTLVALMTNSASASTILNLDVAMLGNNLSSPQTGALILAQTSKPLGLGLSLNSNSTIIEPAAKTMKANASKYTDFSFNTQQVQKTENNGTFDLKSLDKSDRSDITSDWKTKLNASSNAVFENKFDQQDIRKNLYSTLNAWLKDSPSDNLDNSFFTVSASELEADSYSLGKSKGVQSELDSLTLLGVTTPVIFAVFFKGRTTKSKKN